MLIAEYNLSYDRIRNNDQRKSCSLLSLLSGSFESSDLRFDSESYDSNTKIYI